MAACKGRLVGKCILISGAAQGIGRASALVSLMFFARVIIMDE